MFDAGTPLASRLFRLALHIYPAEFRLNYGAPMLQHFEDCYLLARQQPGWASNGRFWVQIAADVLHSGLAERMEEMRTGRWWFWLVVAGLGLGIGVIDYTAVEVQATLLVLLPAAFGLGLIAPRLAWRCGTILGLAIPVTHVVGHMLNIRPPYPDYVIASLLALIPAFLAVYSGAGMRWLLNKALWPPVSS